MEIIILVGIQGAGKSTFYQKHFVDTHVRVNLDMLRSRNKERIFITSCFAMSQKFVVDNTNPTKADRAPYIALAKYFKYKVIGYYFDVSIAECIERNKSRKQPIPIIGLHATNNKLQLPVLEEGYDQIFYVNNLGEAQQEHSTVIDEQKR